MSCEQCVQSGLWAYGQSGQFLKIYNLKIFGQSCATILYFIILYTTFYYCIFVESRYTMGKFGRYTKKYNVSWQALPEFIGMMKTNRIVSKLNNLYIYK